MNTPKILAFAGSTRKDSVNKRLAKIALLAAENAGAETTFIDLHDYNMPLYSEDLVAEHGMPDGVIAFKEMLKNHNGFLITSPEYNGSLTGTLKNAIDWATIKAEGEDRMACWNGKIAGLLAASPGGLGGRIIQPKSYGSPRDTIPTWLHLSQLHSDQHWHFMLFCLRSPNCLAKAVKVHLVISVPPLGHHFQLPLVLRFGLSHSR
jgi:NAD(P)H-dependent FMN reductase